MKIQKKTPANAIFFLFSFMCLMLYLITQENEDNYKITCYDSNKSIIFSDLTIGRALDEENFIKYTRKDKTEVFYYKKDKDFYICETAIIKNDSYPLSSLEMEAYNNEGKK